MIKRRSTKYQTPLEKEVSESMDLAKEKRKKAIAANEANDVEGLFVDKTEEMRVKFK